MTDSSDYTYPSPLAIYDATDLEPLPQELQTSGPDAKSYINPPAQQRSEAYKSFVQPIKNDARGGFDVHVYFLQTDAEQVQFAVQLHERIRREFPELRIYKVFERPLGPHPMGMFEVNIHTPEQFGAFVPWLVINRGPLSALVHPNTGNDVRDHSQLATWVGQPIPLQIGILKRLTHS